jgi:Flp pilus assembly protein TadG
VYRRRVARVRADEGASAVEFALVLTLLMLLLTGVIQFGYTFSQYLQVEHAAREGARWAALRTTAGTVATADTTRYHIHEAAPILDLQDGQIAISVNGSARETAVAADSGYPVAVTVTYSSPVIMPFLGTIIGGGDSIPLSSTAEMRVE